MDQFNKLITEQIHTPATVHYGELGSNYLIVLAFIDGKFVELGELLYRIWREQLYTDDELIQFGKECEDYRLGFRSERPSWRYENKKLTIV